MADVSISSLTQGIPAGNSILPYSTGSSTLGVPVSAILQNVGNVGIGTNNPNRRLHISGSHGDTMQRFQSTGGNGTGSNGPANLLLWASEPGYTFTGCGIGANVAGYESVISNMFSRIDATNGQAYIRFLPSDGTMRFYTGLGDAPQGMIMDSNGNVGIGSNVTPAAKLDVNGTIKASALRVPGCVIQVVQSVKTNTQTMNLVSFEDVQGLSVNVTPKALNSRFFVQVQLSVSTISTQAPYIRITRNGVPIGGGDAAGSRTVCNAFMYTSALTMVTVPINYVDTPTYDTLTPINYKVQIYANSGPSNGNVAVNYYAPTGGDADAASQPRASSSIIVQEIAG